MTRKSFAGAAPTTSLTSGIAGGDAAFSVANGTGYPTGPNPFVVVLDRGLAAEEKILCSGRTANTFTVAGGGRGYDGTSATAHANQATVNHTIDANTIDEANAHVNDTTRDDHPQYLTAGRHDTATRHQFGAALGTPAAATTSSVGDSAAAGAAAGPARADHVHGREAWGPAATTSAVGDAAATGSATTHARADHRHGREAFGVPVNLIPATGSSLGAAATVAQSDHQHGVPVASANTSLPGDAAGAGGSTSFARADHIHGREQVTATGSTIVGGNVPAGKIPYPQTGTVTVATNSAGGFNITLPKPFGSGLISVFMQAANLITANQDWNVTPVKANHSLSAINGLAQHTQDSTGIISGSIDVSFTAWGWD